MPREKSEILEQLEKVRLRVHEVQEKFSKFWLNDKINKSIKPHRDVYVKLLEDVHSGALSPDDAVGEIYNLNLALNETLPALESEINDEIGKTIMQAAHVQRRFTEVGQQLQAFKQQKLKSSSIHDERLVQGFEEQYALLKPQIKSMMRIMNNPEDSDDARWGLGLLEKTTKALNILAKGLNSSAERAERAALQTIFSSAGAAPHTAPSAKPLSDDISKGSMMMHKIAANILNLKKHATGVTDDFEEFELNATVIEPLEKEYHVLKKSLDLYKEERAKYSDKTPLQKIKKAANLLKGTLKDIEKLEQTVSSEAKSLGISDNSRPGMKH